MVHNHKSHWLVVQRNEWTKWKGTQIFLLLVLWLICLIGLSFADDSEDVVPQWHHRFNHYQRESEPLPWNRVTGSRSSYYRRPNLFKSKPFDDSSITFEPASKAISFDPPPLYVRHHSSRHHLMLSDDHVRGDRFPIKPYPLKPWYRSITKSNSNRWNPVSELRPASLYSRTLSRSVPTLSNRLSSLSTMPKAESAFSANSFQEENQEEEEEDVPFRKVFTLTERKCKKGKMKECENIRAEQIKNRRRKEDKIAKKKKLKEMKENISNANASAADDGDMEQRQGHGHRRLDRNLIANRDEIDQWLGQTDKTFPANNDHRANYYRQPEPRSGVEDELEKSRNYSVVPNQGYEPDSDSGNGGGEGEWVNGNGLAYLRQDSAKLIKPPLHKLIRTDRPTKVDASLISVRPTLTPPPPPLQRDTNRAISQKSLDRTKLKVKSDLATVENNSVSAKRNSALHSSDTFKSADKTVWINGGGGGVEPQAASYANETAVIAINKPNIAKWSSYDLSNDGDKPNATKVTGTVDNVDKNVDDDDDDDEGNYCHGLGSCINSTTVTVVDPLHNRQISANSNEPKGLQGIKTYAKKSTNDTATDSQHYPQPHHHYYYHPQQQQQQQQSPEFKESWSQREQPAQHHDNITNHEPENTNSSSSRSSSSSNNIISSRFSLPKIGHQRENSDKHAQLDTKWNKLNDYSKSPNDTDDNSSDSNSSSSSSSKSRIQKMEHNQKEDNDDENVSSLISKGYSNRDRGFGFVKAWAWDRSENFHQKETMNKKKKQKMRRKTNKIEQQIPKQIESIEF